MIGTESADSTRVADWKPRRRPIYFSFTKPAARSSILSRRPAQPHPPQALQNSALTFPVPEHETQLKVVPSEVRKTATPPLPLQEKQISPWNFPVASHAAHSITVSPTMLGSSRKGSGAWRRYSTRVSREPHHTPFDDIRGRELEPRGDSGRVCTSKPWCKRVSTWKPPSLAGRFSRRR